MLRMEVDEVFSLVLRLIGLGAALASTAFYLWKKHAARNWPTLIGQVENYHLDKDYVAYLLYSYEVDGQFYSGEHPLKRRVRSTDHAEKIATPWLHQKVVIRFNPQRPDQSVFLERDQPDILSRSAAQ
jgi:Protein of unknown function (DUF3592)